MQLSKIYYLTLELGQIQSVERFVEEMQEIQSFRKVVLNSYSDIQLSIWRELPQLQVIKQFSNFKFDSLSIDRDFINIQELSLRQDPRKIAIALFKCLHENIVLNKLEIEFKDCGNYSSIGNYISTNKSLRELTLLNIEIDPSFTVLRVLIESDNQTLENLTIQPHFNKYLEVEVYDTDVNFDQLKKFQQQSRLKSLSIIKPLRYPFAIIDPIILNQKKSNYLFIFFENTPSRFKSIKLDPIKFENKFKHCQCNHNQIQEFEKFEFDFCKK
eukprot:403351854